ncbi:MAG: tyrosine recombinase [Pseudomonadota bacterium]
MQRFIQFLKSEKGLSGNTVDAYQRDLQDLANFYAAHNLEELTENQLEDYMSDLLRDLSPRSVARRISAIKQFYIFLHREKIISANPAELVEAPKWQRGLPKILSEEEITLLFDVAYLDSSTKGIRLCVMLEILYASGLRVSELITLKKSCINNYNQYPVLLIKGKGNKERLVPLHEKAYQQIKAYLPYVPKTTEYLFVTRGNQPITRMRVFQLIKALAMKADIDPTKISPHIIRHAFATHMLKNGADLMLLKEILGHANLSTSEIYLHVMPEDLKDLLEQHHPLCQQTSY